MSIQPSPEDDGSITTPAMDAAAADTGARHSQVNKEASEAPPASNSAPHSPLNGEEDNNEDDQDDDDSGRGEEDDNDGIDTMAANEVKNIIIQVLSPYFDDEGGNSGNGAGGGDGADGGFDDGAASPQDDNEDRAGGAGEGEVKASAVTGQRYDHAKAEEWIVGICDGIMERLVGAGKPLKFVVHAMVMRKCGAGLHVCSSCYYAPSDGWLSHSHDLSPHLYVVVTVYWCSV